MWILTFEIHASESDASNVIQAILNQDLGRGDQKEHSPRLPNFVEASRGPKEQTDHD